MNNEIENVTQNHTGKSAKDYMLYLANLSAELHNAGHSATANDVAAALGVFADMVNLVNRLAPPTTNE